MRRRDDKLWATQCRSESSRITPPQDLVSAVNENGRAILLWQGVCTCDFHANQHSKLVRPTAKRKTALWFVTCVLGAMRATCLKKEFMEKTSYMARYAQWICWNARIALAYPEDIRHSPECLFCLFQIAEWSPPTLHFSPPFSSALDSSLFFTHSNLGCNEYCVVIL